MAKPYKLIFDLNKIALIMRKILQLPLHFLLCVLLLLSGMRAKGQQLEVYDHSQLDFIYVKASDSNDSIPTAAVSTLICDGSNDTEKIKEALNNEKGIKKVRLSDGTFNISAPIVAENNILAGAGPEKTIIRLLTNSSSFSPDDTGIRLGKELTTQAIISGVPPNVNKQGAVELQINDNETLAAGQKLLLASEIAFTRDRGLYHIGEIIEVASDVSHDNIIKLKEPIRFDYFITEADSNDTDTRIDQIRIYKYDFQKHIGFANLTIESLGGKRLIAIAEIEQGDSAFFQNVRVKVPQGVESLRSGIRLEHCINTVIEGCVAYHIDDEAASGRKNAEGYGYYLYGVENSIIRDCQGVDNKHTVELGGANFVPITRNIIVKNVTSTNDYFDSFSSHGSAENIIWINCTSLTSEKAGGFIIRSPKQIIINPKIVSKNNAFRIGEPTNPGLKGDWGRWEGLAATDIYIYNADVSAEKKLMEVDDQVNHLTIKGGIWRTSHPIAFEFKGQDCDNLLIDSALIKVNSNPAQAVVDICPQGGRPEISRVVIQNSCFCLQNENHNVLAIKGNFSGRSDFFTDFETACPDDIASWPVPQNPFELRDRLRIDAGLTAQTAAYEDELFFPLLNFHSDFSGCLEKSTPLARSKEIENTDNDRLYKTDVFVADEVQNATLSFPIQNGTYNVYLHFAETDEQITGKGQRVFSIEVEGERRFTDFDIYREAGKRNFAVRKIVENVSVTDGKLEITLVRGTTQNPKISGIEILPAEEPPLSLDKVRNPPEIYISEEVSNGLQLMVGDTTVIDTIRATDQTGGLVSLTADLPSFAVLDSLAPGLAKLTFIPDTAGTFEVSLQATNKSGLSTTRDFTVTADALKALRFDAGLAEGYTAIFNKQEFQSLSPDLFNTGAIRQDLTESISETENTQYDELYETELYMYQKGVDTFKLSIPIKSSTYDVHLHFAEIFSGITAANQRVFSINIEGESAQLDSLDIFAEAGAHTALIKRFRNIEVTDDTLDITFIKHIQSPKISGIEIIPSGTGSSLPLENTAANYRLGAGITAGNTETYGEKEFSALLPYYAKQTNVMKPEREVTIEGSVYDDLYQDEIYNKTTVPTIKLPVDNATYSVHLHFAEVFEGITGSGQRVISVAIEGQKPIANDNIVSYC
jgi:hypothetical protein